MPKLTDLSSLLSQIAIFDFVKFFKLFFLTLLHAAVSFPGSKITFKQLYFLTNQQSAKI
jgi:hypothetical protein